MTRRPAPPLRATTGAANVWAALPDARDSGEHWPLSPERLPPFPADCEDDGGARGSSGDFATSSPSGASDLTSGDDDDGVATAAAHFDFVDALAMLARDSMDGNALSATVEHAIAAVYDEVTRDEARATVAAVPAIVATDTWEPRSTASSARHSDRGGSRATTTTVIDRDSSTSSNNNSDDDQHAATVTTTAASSDPSALKRARRSEIEKKSRQRRQGVLRRMRDDVHRLECVYAELLEKKSTSGELDALVMPARRPRSARDVAQLHARLVVLARSLTDEQSHMQRLLREHEVFHAAVASPALQELVATDHGVPVSKSFCAGFHVLSPADCFAIVRESHDAICRFEHGGAEGFETTGASFMGWTDRRKYDTMTSALQYGFAKRFPHESAAVLLAKTWDIFRDETKMAQLAFDTSVKMRFEVLQTHGEDVYIIRRDHLHSDVPYTFLTVHVLFRLETPEGFTLCFRSIPAPEIQKALEPHEIWFDVFHWTHFNHIRDESGAAVGCEVVTGGSIGDPTMLIARHWLLELIISVLRWESTCVSPLFIKL